MNIQLRKLGAVLIVAAFTVAGCGGSSGGGDTSPPPTDPPPTDPPPSGGIIRTGVAVGAGPITGFGSVIVNGATYDTSSTSWIRDGDDSFSQSDFRVGETVIVKGSIDDNDNTFAETVELDEIVEGPATQAAGAAATVMGQTVRSDAGTLIDDDCNTLTTDVSFDDLSGLTTFFAVEVYGNVHRVQDRSGFCRRRIRSQRHRDGRHCDDVHDQWSAGELQCDAVDTELPQRPDQRKRSG